MIPEQQMKDPVKIAIVGASGYSGEELVRLLLRHPLAELVAVTSRQYAGRTLAEVFPRFASDPKARELRFVEPDPEAIARTANVAFLALPHGVAAEFAAPLLRRGCKVLDLSADFRLRSAAVYKEFYGHEHPAPELLSTAVYGLPEIYADRLKAADLVACAGCYPTSILLPLIPPLRAGLIAPESIVITSLSGVSGAGRKTEVDYLFCECNESLRPYAVPKHRHLSEIEQELTTAAGTRVTVQFTPHLVPVNRGILTTICVEPTSSAGGAAGIDALVTTLAECYARAYAHKPFVRLLGDKKLPDTKHVTGTNFIEIAWRGDPRTGRLIIMSAIDNLSKGASGQAVQCFNIMSGFDEATGLV